MVGMSPTAKETRALSLLAFEELGRAAGGIGGMHQAIADRAFGAAGPAARPARVLHDAISHSVYTALRGGAWVAGRAADAALSRRELRALSDTRRGATVLAVLNGLRGDALADEGHGAAIPMGLRAGGATVTPDAAGLRGAYPDATGRVVVFLHGLFGTEYEWALGDRATYGERLERELGWTPVYLRYNTGCAIDTNGGELADLLERVVAEWPVPVRSLAIVGHSMGGLVARSACHQAEGRRWRELLRHSVTLGTPYAGSPVALGVHQLAGILGKLPETRTFGAFFERRSQGIRDLQRGLAHPPLPTARHHYVSAGSDRLVRRSSAVPRDAEFALHVPGVGHLALLNHDDVYAQLRDWLEA